MKQNKTKNNMKRNIIIVGILAASLFGYNHWLNTPQYSLLQIQKSADTKDTVLFDKYVDTNGIIEEIVEDISIIFIEEMDAEGSSEYSFLDPKIIAAGFVSLFQPAIEDAIKDSFDQFWEDEVETIETKQPKPGLKNNIDSFEMLYLKKEGKIAELGLKVEDPDSGQITELEFKLNKVENYWRVTQISNLEELFRENLDEVEELIDLDT